MGKWKPYILLQKTSNPFSPNPQAYSKSYDDDDGDDDDDDELFFVEWLTDERRFALFLAGTIVRDPHHREFPTRRKQGLILRRTWVQTQLNEVVQ